MASPIPEKKNSSHVTLSQAKTIFAHKAQYNATLHDLLNVLKSATNIPGILNKYRLHILPWLTRVPKPHIAELEAHADVLRCRRQIQGIGSIHDVGRLVQQLGEVADVHERLRYTRGRRHLYRDGGGDDPGVRVRAIVCSDIKVFLAAWFALNGRKRCVSQISFFSADRVLSNTPCLQHDRIVGMIILGEAFTRAFS